MKNKTAILRVNLDVMDKEIESSLRISMAAKSIMTLKEKYEKIIILSHRGRPKGYDKKLSMKKIAEAMSATAQTKISFVPSMELDKIKAETAEKGVYLLENMRFFEGETENAPQFAKFLASLGDIFINDDFATAHRKSASNAGIAKYIPSVAGDLLKAEIKNLSKLTKATRHPYVVIIGGAKVSDKLSVIKKLLPLADKILLGGGAGNAAMAAQGIDIKNSVGKDETDLLKTLIKSKKIIAPIDFRVEEDRILDIGPNTEEVFAEEIRKAKTVLWAGPMGLFEKAKFAKGSKAIATAIAESSAFSVVGGGETTDIVQKMNLSDKFTFVSTGGGAMLEYLSGKKLPALQALNINQ